MTKTDAGLATMGCAAGIVGGLFGIGGGIVMVPAMVLLLGFAQRRAQATSLAAVVPIATVGALIFGGAASVDLPAAILLVVGALVGVRIGTALQPGFSDARLRVIFGLLLVAVSVAMLW